MVAHFPASLTGARVSRAGHASGAIWPVPRGGRWDLKMDSLSFNSEKKMDSDVAWIFFW